MTAILSCADGPGLSKPYIRQDDETRRWVAESWRPEHTVTREQLLTHAQKRIAEGTNPDAPGQTLGWQPIHSAVASFTMSLLNVLIGTDDIATPQIAPTPEGGINVEWLVSGDSLSVTTDLDGVSIVAQFDNGAFAFEPYSWDFDGDVDELCQTLIPARQFLEKVSTGIQHRLPLR